MVVEERVNFKAIELKWQKKWADSKLFEAEPDKSKKKFFVTLPYPYVSGFPHLGHSYTYSKGDVFARYKRMQGYNVLFPFSYHCTGTPIVAAAQRVKEGEPTQISILKQIGISDEEIKKFADPVYWTEFFPVKTKEHLIRAGFSVDWRRSFITTDLNPHYSRLIDWQYLKLKEKGYVVKGSHPVVWCPKCKNPAGDHARKEGEGITPEPMAVVLFKSDDGKIFPCATLRPETTFGVTNLW
ncbi:MAG: class I tRNA ligase family protein, partial [Candidatus Aenigmarchaeota archaeon]|nr:class I tRNA ligase family protein [Candidatus Aenigmarchaeota archaeon]